MRSFSILLFALFMAFSIAGSAAALTVNFEDGTTYNTTALTGFETLGDDMVGMTVVATLSDTTTQTLIWAKTVAGRGGVNGTDWSLGVDGDTFDDNAWTLSFNSSSLTLTNLFIDAGDGDTVFDVVSGSTVSPGSADGKPFNTAYNDGDLTATYSGRVAVGGTLYGDLYRTLNLDFGSNGFEGVMNFTADADNLSIAGDIEPVDPVPEPATLLLLGTGLAGIAGFGRKKFFRKS